MVDKVDKHMKPSRYSQNGSALWDYVSQNKQESHSYNLRYGHDLKPETKHNRRLHWNSEYLNPIDFDDFHVGDVSRLLTSKKVIDDRILNRELRIQMLKNPQFVSQLYEKFKKRENRSQTWRQFLHHELSALLERGHNRQRDIDKSIQFFKQYYTDKYNLLGNVPPPHPKYTSYGYRLYRKERFHERVMEVFKGKEDVFDEPFGLGLEPSIYPYKPQHFDNVVFNPSEEDQQIQQQQQPNVLQRIPTGRIDGQLGKSSKLFDFLQRFQQ